MSTLLREKVSTGSRPSAYDTNDMYLTGVCSLPLIHSQEIVASHQELRCPECRVLVEVRIDELPPNVLLMRILEGMKTAELNNQNNASNKPTCNRNPSQGANHSNAATTTTGYQLHPQQQQQQGYPGQQHPSSGAKIGKSLVPGVASGPESQQQQQQQHPQQGQPHPHQQHQQQHHQHHHHHQPLSRIIASNSPSAATTTTTTTTSTTTATSNSSQLPDLSKIPHAKAFYDFSSSETSDISFRKGDIIILKKKIDHNWCVGEVNGKLGAVPLNHIKVLVPLPFPQCKALYDFRMGPTEEEGCLTFKKGAIIHVLRRVDQNWAEGRIADKIGIFPISFVEMNGLAKQLMDSSLKHFLGNNSNRSVPPTPFDLNASATSSSDTSSSVTTSPNSSTSTTSSNSSTAPSSPTAHFLQSPPPSAAVPSGAAVAGAKSSQNHNPLHNHPQHHHQHQRSDPGNREKRHSLTTATLAAINSAGAGVPGSSSGGSAGALQPSLPIPSHRHSSEMLNHDGGPSDTAAAAAAAAYQKCNLTKASQMYQQHPQLPATYVALYPYKPQKPDELELKKGSIYYVTERCQDGWFKGSNWQKKSGVFPGNYVTIHKGREGGTRFSSSSEWIERFRCCCAAAAAMHTASNGTNSSSPHQHQHQPLQLPELPPRNTTQPQQGLKYIDSIFGRQPSHDGGGGSPSNEPSSTESTPSGATTPAAASTTGKVKKDSSAVSLMKRLTNMKRSKSPTSSSTTVTAGGGCSGGTTNPAYTSDSSLFDETAQMAKPNFQQIVNPVHVRSGSCPSQLLQNLPMDLIVGSVQQHPHQPLLQHQQLNLGSGIAAAPPMYGSQRIKPHKERPSMMHGFKYGEQHVTGGGGGGAGIIVMATKHNTAHEAPASTSHHAAKQQTQIYHRKSQSLDASAIIGQIGPSSSSSQPHGPAAIGGSVASSSDRLAASGPAGLTNGGTPSKSASSSSKSSSSHSQSVRERFKCIVPYPPNSEYELELRVGDIVMVHKKRDNGWYKGTHARSGKTGLFPASFVEPDI
ncbi:hypothetical protein AND_002110 [Anopheles darlingi]|uniref:RING-type E3 ubiquitin transferase n=1 Tax=Anopheles darlingi TaxID=43151 RepID=W5JTN3_ANODA|nr:hypothetical protein AND_002110 [Anopheles darlingi]